MRCQSRICWHGPTSPWAAPPPGFGPVQLEYIRTESVPKNGLTATLFYLAERRLIDLQQINAEKWRIRGLAQRSAWADVDSVSAAVEGRFLSRKAPASFRIRSRAVALATPQLLL